MNVKLKYKREKKLNIICKASKCKIQKRKEANEIQLLKQEAAKYKNEKKYLEILNRNSITVFKRSKDQIEKREREIQRQFSKQADADFRNERKKFKSTFQSKQMQY